MTAAELFRSGQLQAAIDAQIQEVRTHPTDHGRRVFLFELMSFAGEFDRARRQIDAVSYPEPEREAAVQQYRKLLDAEDHRRKVLKEGVMPAFLTQPPQWLYHRLAALKALIAGNPQGALEAIEQADREAAPVAGTLNGQSIEAFRDADDLFGPVIEVLAQGGYYWVPLEQVAGLTANAPAYPRDLLWFPVKLSIKDGPAGDAFLPTIYYGSATNSDEAVKLGRVTQWTETEPVRGTGLRMLAANEDLVSVLELREFLATT